MDLPRPSIDYYVARHRALLAEAERIHLARSCRGTRRRPIPLLAPVRAALGATLIRLGRTLLAGDALDATGDPAPAAR